LLNVTPLDIRRQSFRHATFGGYRKEEVSEFLAQIAESWQEMDRRNQVLEEQIQYTRSELEKLKQMETTLLKTLQQTQEASQLTLAQARKQADILILEGQIKADALLKEAQQKAQGIIDQAQEFAQQTLRQTQKELDNLQYAHQYTQRKRNQMLGDLTDFLEDALLKVRRLTDIQVENTAPKMEEQLQQFAPLTQQPKRQTKPDFEVFIAHKEQQKQQKTAQTTPEPPRAATTAAQNETHGGLPWDILDIDLS
jgi:cell division initiation protein